MTGSADITNRSLIAWPTALLWLTVAALADWLITRTLTRAAIFMPTTPTASAAMQALSAVGRLASTASALLAIGLMGWFAWTAFNRGRKFLPAAIVAMLGLMMLFLIVPPGGWAAVAYHLVILAVLAAVVAEAWGSSSRPASLILAAAIASAELFLVANAFATAIGGSAPGTTLFNLSEVLFVVVGYMLWWIYGRQRVPLKMRAIPGLVALAFSAMYLAQPAMTGILSIWSLGLTLFMPWPIYALSLAAALTASVAQLRSRRPEGLAILLLLAAGLAPQLSHQFLMGLIGLLVISRPSLVEREEARQDPIALPA